MICVGTCASFILIAAESKLHIKFVRDANVVENVLQDAVLHTLRCYPAVLSKQDLISPRA